MSTPRSTARKLATDAEYRLVEESFAPSVADLDAKALRNRIERARRLRDKYRKQAQGRSREIRGKADQRRKAPARSNVLSVAKHKLFEETLGRFEKSLAQREKARSKPKQSALAKKALALKRKAKPAGGKPASRTVSGGMKSSPTSRRKAAFPAPGARKGEQSAAVKRAQARKDSRA
ncbi:MAG: hypothetical protein ACK4NA_01965 [Alphaproteobacteria bacterium]